MKSRNALVSRGKVETKGRAGLLYLCIREGNMPDALDQPARRKTSNAPLRKLERDVG